VVRADSSRGDRPGYANGEVDLVVEGRLLALGTPTHLIHLSPSGRVRANGGCADWIHLESARESRFEFCAR
jgi:hypothetical protein